MELIDGLPPSVAKIAAYLALAAKGYDNHLKWNEQAKFKADLMNTRRRWFGVSPAAFEAKPLSEGMRPVDAALLLGWLRKAQEGRRLVAQSSYRDFKFGYPVDEDSATGLGVRSLDWEAGSSVDRSSPEGP